MPQLSERIEIDAPPDRVWPLLSDPAVVAGCIPGATLEEAEGEGVYKGTIRVKFGPTVATFRGEATLAYDHDARRCTIDGRGIDRKGASRATASGTVTAEGDTVTVLTVDGSFNVTGPLETFANAGGVHVARALLQDFAANMAQQAGAQQAGSVSADDDTREPAAAAPAREAGGIGLLWRAFVGWLRQLFTRSRQD
ncbi:MAG: SRPBCC family protein [Acetobacterales bacterium]